MKRIIVTILILATLIIVSVKPAYASSAEIMGYSIEGWSCLEDISVERTDVEGSMYHAGKAEMWIGLYRLHDYDENYTFYAVLVTTQIQATKNEYWDQEYWSNRYMEIEVKSNNNLSVFTYFPEVVSSTYQTSISFEVGLSDGGKLNTSLGFSSSQQHNEINLDIDKNIQDITLTHSFSRYNNKSVVRFDGSVYRTNVKVNNIVIFREEGIVTSSRSFGIIYDAAIYRKGIFNNATVIKTFSESIFF